MRDEEEAMRNEEEEAMRNEEEETMKDEESEVMESEGVEAVEAHDASTSDTDDTSTDTNATDTSDANDAATTANGHEGEGLGRVRMLMVEKDVVLGQLPFPPPPKLPAKVKRGRGRPHGSGAHNPTKEMKEIVERCCGSNWSHRDISRLLGISDETLRKRYRKELDSGKQKCIARVEHAVYQVAADPTHRDFASMAKFFLKSKSNWTETSRVEVTGADGQPIESRSVVQNTLDVTKLNAEQRNNLREILLAATRPSLTIDQASGEVTNHEECDDEDDTDDAGEEE